MPTSRRNWLLALLSVAGTASAFPTDLQKPLHHDEGLPGSHGAVACESARCSKIGVDLMRQGGTAADALVGSTLCVGVMGMYHSGIGGGGFMLIRTPEGRYESVDYREMAPEAAYQDMFEGNVIGSVFGGLSVSVPGELRGLEYLHKTYGRLPWKTVVTPAVEIARNGFEVNADLITYMTAATKTGGNFLTEDPVWAEDFAPNGTLVELGDIITRKRYADTLEQIGKHGVDIFYHGKLTEPMVKAIRARNGTITFHDFARYKAYVRPAVSALYDGKRLFSTSAPSSGAIALAILSTMDQFSKEKGNADADAEANVNLTTHHFDEALRFGYGARTHFGDPDFVPGLDALEADLLTPAWALATRRKIQDNATLPIEAYNPAEGSANTPDHGTSHVVAADDSGLAISSTTTINTLFGSLVMDPTTGVILNNEMNDFSIPNSDNEFGYPPSPANFVRSLKRPMSSMSPLMAEDAVSGKLLLVTGAAGGSKIISATAQVVWHVLAHGLTITEALAQPRLHDQLVPNRVVFEEAWDNATVASMIEKGHNVTWVAWGGSSAQGIRVDENGIFEAAGEPRQAISGGDVF